MKKEQVQVDKVLQEDNNLRGCSLGTSRFSKMAREKIVLLVQCVVTLNAAYCNSYVCRQMGKKHTYIVIAM